MRLIQLTRMIQSLAAAVDSGRFGDVTIDEVHRHAAAEDVVPWLRRRMAGHVTLDLIDAQAEADLHGAFARYLNAYAACDWGIKRSGLCLLLAVTTNLIQQKEFEDDVKEIHSVRNA